MLGLLRSLYGINFFKKTIGVSLSSLYTTDILSTNCIYGPKSYNCIIQSLNCVFIFEKPIQRFRVIYTLTTYRPPLRPSTCRRIFPAVVRRTVACIPSALVSHCLLGSFAGAGDGFVDT